MRKSSNSLTSTFHVLCLMTMKNCVNWHNYFTHCSSYQRQECCRHNFPRRPSYRTGITQEPSEDANAEEQIESALKITAAVREVLDSVDNGERMCTSLEEVLAEAHIVTCASARLYQVRTMRKHLVQVDLDIRHSEAYGNRAASERLLDCCLESLAS